MYDAFVPRKPLDGAVASCQAAAGRSMASSLVVQDNVGPVICTHEVLRTILELYPKGDSVRGRGE